MDVYALAMARRAHSTKQVLRWYAGHRAVQLGGDGGRADDARLRDSVRGLLDRPTLGTRRLGLRRFRNRCETTSQLPGDGRVAERPGDANAAVDRAVLSRAHDGRSSRERIYACGAAAAAKRQQLSDG